MDLDEDRSEYKDLVDSAGKVVVFAKWGKRISKEKINVSTDHILFPRIWYPKWNKLLKQIRNIMIAVFEGYFRRNNWFQQSCSIVDDIGHVLISNDYLLKEMTGVLDAIIESFVYEELYGQTVTINDIPDVLGYGRKTNEPLDSLLREDTLVYRIKSKNSIYIVHEVAKDEIQRSVNAAVEELLQHDDWIDVELNSQMNENLSFGADVLPALQTLNIAALHDPPLVRAFCRVVSRSSLSSSLSCIQIECLPIKSNQQACNVLLDDTLAQLHDHVQIEILKRYSGSLLKLKSKGVLVDRFGYLCTRK
ncbi:hypothetical protein ABKN59_011661 [Abortiporus biennis]